MANRTPTDAKTRCTATEGAQQCLKATHPKVQNHTWGPQGETKEWNADGTHKPEVDPVADTRQLPRVVVPEPLPDAQASDYFNGDDTDDERRVAALKAEADDEETDRRLAIGGNEQAMDRLATVNGHARPVSVSGAPGSRLADVSSISSTLTLFGIPVELQDEFTWYQIAKHAIDSAIEEIIRTRQPSDPALLTGAYDAIGHVVQARGLLKGAGS